MNEKIDSGNILSIAEFLHLTRISESDLLTMLENGELTFTTGLQGELRIDISSLTPDDIARRTPRQASPEDSSRRELLEEVVANELVSNLDPIIEESLYLALDWFAKRHNSQP